MPPDHPVLDLQVNRSNPRKGPATMATPEGQDAGEEALVFAAYNNHTEHCGLPPRLHTTDNRRLYYGYFENRHGEQFIFIFDPATKTGTITGGDLDWGHPKSFTIAQVQEALHTITETVRAMDAEGKKRIEESGLTIDTAQMLGSLTGVSGKDEVIWLRACLAACATLT